MRVNILGAGRVGQTFLGLCARAGFEVGDVASRSPASAQAAVARMGAGFAVGLDEMRPADLWVIAVPDGEIAAAAGALAARALPPATALHFSGFHPSALLNPLRQLGWQTASLHPVMSFADPHKTVEAFDGTYCGIEGTAEAVALLEEVLPRLGGVPFPIRAEAKALYHGAAVISNNFTTVLQAIAQEAWAEAGVPEEVAAALQAGLLRDVVENVTALGPRDALTGPAARGDTAVVSAQGAAFAAWHAEVGEIYDRLSALAGRLKAEGKI